MQGITESFRCFTCASIGCEMAAVLKSRAPRLDALYEHVGYLGSSVYHQLTVHLASSKCSVSQWLLRFHIIFIIFVFFFARTKGSCPPDNENQQRQGHSRFEE
jgi:hypothetical protein